MTGLMESGLASGGIALLLITVAIALVFEFVNGFHDTANAVATVIYTNSLRPGYAVVLSGILNFCGVFVGGLAVALGIMKLLPADLLMSGGTGGALAMVLALLFSAILWNLGTWYLGLPASSSHTLIGSILGVGVSYSALNGHFGEGVNWTKAQDIGVALLVSPLIGAGLAGGLLLLSKLVISDPRAFAPAPRDTPPPVWIRALLIFTCGGVSFSHGSNDGQKGVGLVMLILIGMAPAGFALDLDAAPSTIGATIAASQEVEAVIRAHAPTEPVLAELDALQTVLEGRQRVADVPPASRFTVRHAILKADKVLSDLDKKKTLTEAETKALAQAKGAFRLLIDYAPTWVLVAIATSLGLGTMVGWKRIVVTIGEKIGKSHLSYAQGASAELVAMSTIGMSAWLGLPVSTTHVLSSGIAGTMLAQGSGLQGGTVRNIALAWVLTLPVTMMLSGGLFAAFWSLT